MRRWVNPWGMYNLAVCYLYGHGVAPNHTAAFDWLHKARCPGLNPIQTRVRIFSWSRAALARKL